MEIPKSLGKERGARKERAELIPPAAVFGGFEVYTKGIGGKLMQKMGYKRGKGIGRKSQGRVAPLKAEPRKEVTAGLGFVDEKSTGIVDDDVLPVLHIEILKKMHGMGS